MLKILAPMAGYTDIAFREICQEFEADETVTEMVSAQALVYGDKKTAALLEISDREKDVTVQIFGHDPDIMADAAKILNDYDFTKVNINFGCPAPKIVKGMNGSYLLKEPSLVYDIVKSVVEASTKPVTCKVRKSFDGVDALKSIKNIEAAGASEVIVHGRSREEFYTGEADWDYIKKIKETLNIPVIGNGDIFSPEDALSKIKYSGVDGIAIGRGSIGNPFIFRQIEELISNGDYYRPTVEEKLNVLKDQLDREIKYKGKRLGLIEMRKVYSYYFKGMKNSKEIRNKLNTLTNLDEIIEIIDEYAKNFIE